MSNKDGKTLADVPRLAAQAEVHAYGVPGDAADQDVRRVIAANTGKVASIAVSSKTGKASGARFGADESTEKINPVAKYAQLPRPAF